MAIVGDGYIIIIIITTIDSEDAGQHSTGRVAREASQEQRGEMERFPPTFMAD